MEKHSVIKSSTARDDLRNADDTALPPVTASTPMPPVKPTKPEIRWIRNEQVITGPGGRPCTDEEKKALVGATIQITTSAVSKKQLEVISAQFPDLQYVGDGIFESVVVPVSVEESYEHMSATAEEMYHLFTDEDFPKGTPQYPEKKADQKLAFWYPVSVGGVYVRIAVGDKFEADQYLIGEIDEKYLIKGCLRKNHFSEIVELFPNVKFGDQGTFTIPITEDIRYGGSPKFVAQSIVCVLNDYQKHALDKIGIQPDKPWPRTEEADKAFELADGHVPIGGGLTWNFDNPLASPDLGYFLTGRQSGNAPPRPGSEELARQSVILHNLKKHEQTNVDQAIQILSKHVEQLNPTATEAEKDPAIAALGALHRVKKEARKKKFHSRLKWFFSLLLLIGIGVTFYFYGSLLYTRGHYTTVMTCKVPFGDAEITGNRYSTFTTKSLLGYRVGSDVPEVETTEIKLPGENLTVLGFDSTTSKWWRVNYGKGEANTPKLRTTDMYWFVGDKDKTSLVKYADFCK